MGVVAPRTLDTVVWIAAGVACTIGLLVLVGWVTGDTRLLVLAPGEPTVKANTAVGLLCGSLALVSLQLGGAMRRYAHLAAAVAAVAMMAIGLTTLAEYVGSVNLGIDELLFTDGVVGPATSHAGRMAPNSALDFALLGGALALAGARSSRAMVAAQAMALMAMLTTLLALLGLMYQARFLLGVLALNRMAIPTMIGFAALGAGVLVSTSTRGWVGEITATRTGRLVAGRLLPAGFLVPMAIGGAVLWGIRMHVYDAAFGASLMAAAESVSFTMLVWSSVRSLNHLEGEKQLSSEDELTHLHNRRGFLARTRDGLDECRATATGATLLFVDLDGMKQINDELGHHAGDAALVEMAVILRATLGASDVMGRLGGDEFAAFCPGLTPDTAAVTIARLQSRITSLNASEPRAYRLACSVGATAFDPASGESVDELLVRADAAMYEQKRARKVTSANKPVAIGEVIRRLSRSPPPMTKVAERAERAEIAERAEQRQSRSTG